MLLLLKISQQIGFIHPRSYYYIWKCNLIPSKEFSKLPPMHAFSKYLFILYLKTKQNKKKNNNVVFTSESNHRRVICDESAATIINVLTNKLTISTSTSLLSNVTGFGSVLEHEDNVKRWTSLIKRSCKRVPFRFISDRDFSKWISLSHLSLSRCVYILLTLFSTTPWGSRQENKFNNSSSCVSSSFFKIERNSKVY